MNKGRIYIYEALRNLLEAPLSEEYFNELAADTQLSNLASISTGAQLIYEFVHQDEGNKVRDVLQEQHDEYMRLFVGPGHVEAPIWESVYFDKEGLMFGERTLQVRNWYKKYNLEFHLKGKQPDDHIATELDFMAYLLKTELSLTDISEVLSNQKDQKDFLEQHLLTWTNLFAEKVVQHSESKLYRGIVILLNEFLALESGTIAENEEE